MTLFFCIYNLLFIPLFFILVHIAGLVNKKIRKGLLGRYFPEKKLETRLLETRATERVWMHVSSMGEYEQGKPVIDILLEQNPEMLVILTVFSPSAFDHIKLDHPRIILTYLPMDTWFRARKFITMVKPHVAIVVRHDIWPNFQWRLRKMNIPSFLIDASISDKRHRVYKTFQIPIRSVMQTFTKIMTVSHDSKERYAMLYPDTENIEVFGDTRYDRVVQRSINVERIQWLLDRDLFVHEKTCVLGSSWPSGEKIWLPTIKEFLDRDKEFRVIIAPHEIHKEHIRQIVEELKQLDIPYKTYSDLENTKSDLRVLLVDRIGLLANLYACGKLAYVGGGFGPGVHNVLEPAAHGCAVLFGPRHDVSVEPQQLINAGGGQVIRGAQDIHEILQNFLSETSHIVNMGNQARDFIAGHTGASEGIAMCVKNSLPKK